ncbi:MAG: fatty acid desaturase [Gammaproteobacteria bacterium]|nr:fatty acid desaturase [Gammaproteobacteria bacterium]
MQRQAAIVTAARDLQRRSDNAGIKQLALHAGLLLAGAWAVSIVPQPWWIAAFAGYAVTLVFLFAPLHECIHRTAFRSRWLNECCAHLCGFVLLLPPRYFRCFHLAHHRHTQLPGRDPELMQPSPATFAAYLWRMSGWPYWRDRVRSLCRHAAGSVDEAFIEPAKRTAVTREARLFITGYAAVLGLAGAGLGGALLIYWWLPAVFGMPVLRGYLLAEHSGCVQSAEMLRNSRTVHSNRLLRLLAWNMPYHTAHHCQPAVPFHALPRLHARLHPAPLVQSRGYLQFHVETIARLQRRRAPAAEARRR